MAAPCPDAAPEAGSGRPRHSVGVIFELRRADARPGEMLRVAGAGPELGDWGAEDSCGLQLRTSVSVYPMWTMLSPVWIEPQDGQEELCLEYKYIRDLGLWGQADSRIVWEDGIDNRRAKIPCTQPGVWVVSDAMWESEGLPQIRPTLESEVDRRRSVLDPEPIAVPTTVPRLPIAPTKAPRWRPQLRPEQYNMTPTTSPRLRDRYAIEAEYDQMSRRCGRNDRNAALSATNSYTISPDSLPQAQSQTPTSALHEAAAASRQGAPAAPVALEPRQLGPLLSAARAPAPPPAADRGRPEPRAARPSSDASPEVSGREEPASPEVAGGDPVLLEMEQLRRQVEDLRKQNEELRKFSSSCATSPPLPGGRGGQSPDSAPPSTASPRSGALSPDSARCCPAGLPEARLPHPPTELERMLLRRRERILDKVSMADPELVAAQAALETAAQ